MYSTFILAGISAFAFIVQWTVPWVTREFALVSSEVITKPWMLVTAIFLHGDIAHLLYNMFALVLFGMILESIIGRKKFVAIFFLSGILASIGSALLYPAALGASGAIFGILGTLAALRPNMQVFVGYFPMPMIIAAVLWAAGDVIGLFIPSGTANLAHLIGLGFGIAAGFFLRERYGARNDGREIYNIDDKEFEDWEKKYMR